ncbi:OLC1v1007178C1 [Oldenlandia corymbosa var. corymbosa]|uniref:Calcium-transporting ATPase n=1 Tax=Oldenlandia corymbosa var. corymbosa TaxID=529605 RepID=A0AAV1DLG1_OLDCO|nr:OLC1v1007178C1 [Oldenlandia corymbosa var. corymbosa]
MKKFFHTKEKNRKKKKKRRRTSKLSFPSLFSPAVSFKMASKLNSYHSKYGTLKSLLANIGNLTRSKAHKRWRIAYLAICFSMSLSKTVLSRAGTYGAFWKYGSPSFTIIEVEPMIDFRRLDQQLLSSDFALPQRGNANGSSLANIDQNLLAELVKNKNLEYFESLGRVEGLAKTLNTNLDNGVKGDENDINARRDLFGSNTYQKPPPLGLLYFIIEALKDTTILILLGCAALSLGFGIRENGAKEGWYEGGSIIVAVFLVVVVSAGSNFRQERQFDKLSKISDNIQIDAVRDGRRQKVSIFDILVGDIVFLSIGDQIPADGVFIDGHSLQVDESSMTGESDHVQVDSTQNPFLISGSKVADGYGRMLVTSVGTNTSWGEMMSSITRNSNEQTPLQARLNKLTSSIGKVGLAVAFIVLIVLLVRYFTGNTQKDGKTEYQGSKTNINDVFNSILRIVSAAVTIVVVAIPEGLPLAVTLTLAYSMKRMMADQAMVRKLSACETMGSATVICTDKTGTLTLNQMKVTKFWFGDEHIAERYKDLIHEDVLEMLYLAIGLNTTASIYKSESGSGVPEFTGSPTEKAILSWAVQDLSMDMDKVKRNYSIIHVDTFNSEKKRSGVLIRRKADNTHQVHWKGAAEILLALCSSYYQSNGDLKPINEEQRTQFKKIIEGMAASSLRCIAFAHKQITDAEMQQNENPKRLKEDDLTLLGIVGIKDPCRPGARKAIETCRAAGVDIKMITGDNVFTAKAIATECRILEPNHHHHQQQQQNSWEVIEGVQFRNCTEEERMLRIDEIRVMARSSPFDKLLMVQCLKQKGHVVAVTGDGTNDAPALKEADIGLSMGIQGTEVAKESSDIVILDDDFASVATVLKWGRSVYNNIQKFIQFQLTVNVAALAINFIAAVSAGEIPLTAVQLLWVNLIMDTLGALALATERPTKELMDKPPVGRTEPLITKIMWRNLLAQSLYQIIILLTLQFRGKSILNVNTGVKDTIIFNTFVLCQVFNEFNSRKLEKQNVFEGLHKNRLFVGIVTVTVVLQFVMVEFLKKFADTERLKWNQWMICIGMAALTWPIGFVVKLIPVTPKPYLNLLRSMRSR